MILVFFFLDKYGYTRIDLGEEYFIVSVGATGNCWWETAVEGGVVEPTTHHHPK